MALPPPLVGLTVRAKAIAANGVAVEGAIVTLMPTVPAVSPAGDVLIVPSPLSQTSAADGSVQWTDILATDSPGLSNKVPYRVTVTQDGVLLQHPYVVELLTTQAVGGVLRLDDVAPATSPGPLASYVLAASVGTVGGPAGPLDATGKVPAAQLPVGGGSIPSTIVDAKGDIVAASAADTPARHPVGTNGQALLADSAQATGLRWATLAVSDISSLQALLDGKVAVALVDAKGDLLAGTGPDTIGRLTAGSNGQILYADSNQSSGLKWGASPAGIVYPLAEGYGFHSASVLPDHAKAGAGGWGAWHTRIWVPADQAITKAAIFITTAAAGTATLAAFAVYAEDAQTLLASSAHDNNLFLSTGLRSATMQSPVAAQSTGRFVRVLVTSNYSGSSPSAMFTDASTGDAYNTGTGIRTAFFSALAAFPASFNPATGAGLPGWTPSSFLPVILLG